MSHRRLLNKMASYGVADPILLRFSSYLSIRNQVAQANGLISKPRLVSSGVIQGGMLGPQPYLFDGTRNEYHSLFANDIKIVYTFSPEALESTIRDISQDLASFGSWANDCTIEFSAEKYNIMGYK